VRDRGCDGTWKHDEEDGPNAQEDEAHALANVLKEVGVWVLGLGFWVLGFGFWDLGFGLEFGVRGLWFEV